MPWEKGEWFGYFCSLDKTRAKSFPTTTTRHCSAVVTLSDPLTALPGVDTKMERTESLRPEVNWFHESCVIFRLCWFTAAYLIWIREWGFYTGPVLEWIERVLDSAFQNKMKSAKSSSKTSVKCWTCSTFLATDSKFDLGADLTQYQRILLQAA